jgi:hypothetical protein
MSNLTKEVKEVATLETPTNEGATKKADSKGVVLRCLFYLLVVVIIVFNLFPFVWALLSSFRPQQPAVFDAALTDGVNAGSLPSGVQGCQVRGEPD